MFTNSRNFLRLSQQQQQRSSLNNSRSVEPSSVALALPSAELMNISAEIDRESLSSEERERRIRLKFCIYCDDNDHYRKKCLNKPALKLQIIE